MQDKDMKQHFGVDEGKKRYQLPDSMYALVFFTLKMSAKWIVDLDDIATEFE